MRWALAGLGLGAVAALLVFAPASWLASYVSDATEGRLLLADARGTVWHGSAVMVLTGGPGSRDASALPGRVQWRLGLDGAALALRAHQACCINGELLLRLRPGLGVWRVELPAVPGVIGQWPASWLVGLGTPWNTLQPSGALRLSSSGLNLEWAQGRWALTGAAELELGAMSSRVSTLEVLGSYRLALSGNAARGETASLRLSTVSGALQLSGSGQWAGPTLHFTGQASAALGAEAVLGNLLNIIGRRRGALSVISIG